MKIMFIGTSSNVGKTLISAVFCRYLRSKMLSAVPFKAVSISPETFITDDGAEIDTGQALRSWACDRIPSAKINPIRVKMTKDGRRTYVCRDGREICGRDEPMSSALDAFDSLCDLYDAVVAEGSGSAADTELYDQDVADIEFAASRNIPMILVGDIERGGVFAALYGTWRLIDEKRRHLLKGFVINKYSGNVDVLKSGIEKIESLTGMRCFGVIPLTDARLPLGEDREDGISAFSDGEIDSFVRTLDEMLDKIKDSTDMEGIMKLMAE